MVAPARADVALALAIDASGGGGADSDINGGASFLRRAASQSSDAVYGFAAPSATVSLRLGNHYLSVSDDFELDVLGDASAIFFDRLAVGWRYQRNPRRRGGWFLAASLAGTVAWRRGSELTIAEYDDRWAGGDVSGGKGRVGGQLALSYGDRDFSGDASTRFATQALALRYSVTGSCAASLGYSRTTLDTSVDDAGVARHLATASLELSRAPSLLVLAQGFAGIERVGADPDAGIERRSDRVAGGGLRGDWSISPALAVFAQATAIRVASDADTSDYDRIAATAGVRGSFGWSSADGSRDPYERSTRRSSVRVMPSGRVRFELEAPAAREVAVIGEFNDWDAERGRLSDADGDGRWSAELVVAPGRWRYNFRVDGAIVVPPSAAVVERDSFGSEAGVLRVPSRVD